MTTQRETEGGQSTSASGSGPRARILVVEDSQDMGAILVAALEGEGCQAFVARTGELAISMARMFKPDLITLDLGLPGMRGEQVIAALRADPALRDIPIVAVSAYARDLEPALSAMVARVIQKPFYLSEVVGAVTQTLKLPVPPEPLDPVEP